MIATPLSPASADEVGRVVELLEDEGVVTSVPAPTLSDWVGAVAARFRDWVEELVPMGGFAASIGNVLIWVLGIAGAVALVLLVVLLVRRLWTQASREADDEDDSFASEIAVGETREPSDWRAAIDECLRAGDARGAVEALWWYLLTTLGSERDAAVRTGRVLLRRLGRDDLQSLLQRLERATYGPTSPPLELVRELVVSVDEALSSGASAS